MKLVLMLPLLATILGPAATTATPRDLAAAGWHRSTPFLTPAAPLLALPATDPRRRSLCRNSSGERCPQLLINGGTRQGTLPVVDPVLSAKAPHVRVSFVLQRMQVVGDAAAWLDPPDVSGDLYWVTHGSAADEESGSFQISVGFNPDAVDAAGYFFTPPVIYDALILNACAGFGAFPVEHDGNYDPGYGLVTPFHGYDATTIDHTGFYDFSYEIGVDAEPGDGDAQSGLHLSGTVNVTCTAASAL